MITLRLCPVLLSLLTCSPHLLAGEVAQHGRLQVQGNKIVDESGSAVSFAGMSLFWSQWMGQFYTKETVAWLHTDWKVPIVRAAMGIEAGGYLTNSIREEEKIRTVIDAAIANDMYVIVDWHDHHAELHSQQAAEFFGRIAATYGASPNVIYEIYNEPLDVSWTNVLKPYANTVINAIRKHDPDNLIIVGTPRWSQRVDVAATDPIEDANVAYSLHFYAGTHKDVLRQQAQEALDKGIALFVTEWGTVNATGDGEVDTDSVNRWIAFLQSNQISHLNWAISDKREGAAVLQPASSPFGGWTDEQLTESGKLVRQLIRSWAR